MSDALNRSLRLLRQYHQGKRALFLSANARVEQGLAPLSDDDRAVIQAIVELPEDDQTQAIDQAGPERVLAALQATLRFPLPVTRGRELFPYVVRQAGTMTWLFERVRLGETGVVAYCVVCDEWAPDVHYGALPAYPDPGSLMANRCTAWGGFMQLEDDVGTSYKEIGQAIGFQAPLLMELPERRVARVSQDYRQSWFPGVPRGARRITFVPGEKIYSQRPASSPPPWSREEHQLFEPHNAISILIR
jgi:hypothetical protein